MKRIKYITEASLSFALIIAANSMAEWLPFVPNAESGLPHLLMELINPLTYCLTWILCMFIGFFAPASAKGPVVFGALGLIYANMATALFRQCGFEIPIAANVAGTIANNIGAPLLYLLWEQYFASEDDDQCIADILVGRGLPVLLFALLGLISSSSQTMGLRAVILLVAAVTLLPFDGLERADVRRAPARPSAHLSQCHGLVLEKRFMHRLTCLPVHGFKIGVYK